jgi:hypothetical protein
MPDFEPGSFTYSYMGRGGRLALIETKKNEKNVI